MNKGNQRPGSHSGDNSGCASTLCVHREVGVAGRCLVLLSEGWLEGEAETLRAWELSQSVTAAGIEARVPHRVAGTQDL